MKVTAKFQNETDVTGPYSGETKTIEVKINAEQDDGNGGMDVIPSIFTGSIYRWHNKIAKKGDSIVPVNETKWCEIYEGTAYECFNTESECIDYLIGNDAEETVSCQQRTGIFGGVGDYTTDASTLNKTSYLKHDVVDNRITASYVCFIFNNTEHCMKGGNTTSYSTNRQIIINYQAFYNLPNNANPGCSFYDSSSYCHGGDFRYVHAGSEGDVYVYSTSSVRCFVSEEGKSNCIG